jgi:hypothetical protein
MRKGFAQLLLLIPVFVLLAATAAFFYFTQNKTPKTQTSIVGSQSPAMLTTSPLSNLQPLSSPTKAHCSKTPVYPKTNNDTDNWNVYIDDYLCISMKYPKGWYAYPASDKNNSGNITNYDREKQHTDITLEKGKYLIEISYGVVGETRDGLLKYDKNKTGLENFADMYIHDVPNTTYKQINVDGSNGLLFSNSKTTFTVTVFAIEKNGKVLAFMGAGFEKNRYPFDEIIYTLKNLD